MCYNVILGGIGREADLFTIPGQCKANRLVSLRVLTCASKERHSNDDM
jgi:hypothetical protein